MDQLIQQIVERTGISEEQARTAIQTVAEFAKTKLPPAFAGQVDQFMNGQLDLSQENPLGNLLGGFGNLFG